MSDTASRIATMLARRPTRIHIAVNGVWSADLADGSTIFSYEKLDYHTDCREFLEGLRDAGIPFIFHGEVVL
jgi:hypothetical protein